MGLTKFYSCIYMYLKKKRRYFPPIFKSLFEIELGFRIISDTNMAAVLTIYWFSENFGFK